MSAINKPNLPAKVSPELPHQSPAEHASLREWIDRFGVLSAVVKTAKGKTLQGRAVEAVAKDLGLPSTQVPVIVADIPEEEEDLVRVILELSGRDGSKLPYLRDQVLASFPEFTAREIARKFPHLGDRRTLDRNRRKLLASGAIAPLPRKDKRGYVHQPPAVLTTARLSEKIGRNLEAAREHVQGGMMSRRKLNTAINLKARSDYARGAPMTTSDHIQILNSDFRNLAVEADTFDLAIADPPWSKPWTDRDRTNYAAKVFAAVKPGGFVLAYTGHNQLLAWADIYRSAGFTHRWTLTVIWHDGPSIRNDGNVNTGNTPIILLQKGGPFKTPNVIFDTYRSSAGEKQYHPWQQAVHPLTYWVGRLTHAEARVLDLTLCTGTSAVATVKAGMGRSFVGSEIDPELCAVARHRVADAFAEVE